MDTCNISDYEAIVKDRAGKRTNENLPNTTIEHAAISMRYLFQNATDNIRIVSNEFYEDFWVRFQAMLSNFLNRSSAHLEIVLLDKYNDKGVLSSIKNSFSSKVDVWLLNRKELAKKIYNFVTVDPVGYRIELSDDQKKDKIVQGVINFGNAEGTAELNRLFEDIKKIADKV